ncbi:MAG: TetR/AcrR family transcriptional regulator [Muribaculaceae bacterium]|nr:TetR/AcrR family transcriptional regulator [Muribaculaceae bacterium]
MAKRQDKQQNNDTEVLILQAAEREFLSKGFIGARTTSIAEAAGVTHAMFHYYFRTKEKLFERIISEKITLLKEALTGSIVDINAPLTEKLRNLISNHLEFIAANPDLPRFLIGEIFSNPERSASFLDSLAAIAPIFISTLQQQIDVEADKGWCRRVDAKMLMLDIVSLNVFAYMAAPAVNAALGDCMADSEAFLEMRKKENYDTIMRKLRP